ncbi:hypothetical protein CEXT_186291 [Caerostris extrusa]|uniref:Uncharacterized protein n=1 Tax=Caerostris extrusa TaxID=172846 RepID=A0AAV4XV24_CAEEX|nr:hypothetical protein CEXT_186291 [Caerostris extrusa]
MCLASCNFCRLGDFSFSVAHLSLLIPRNDVVKRKKHTVRWVSFSACDSRLSLATVNFIMNRSNEMLGGKKKGLLLTVLGLRGGKLQPPPPVNDTPSPRSRRFERVS